MSDFFVQRPAWYVLGPLIGLCVFGLFALANRRLGVLGGYSNLFERVDGRIPELGWKTYLLGGVLIGALIQRLLAGSPTVEGGYGWLSRTFESDAVVGAALVGGGVLIGFGAKLADGCTSGNGLGGCSSGSPASFAATATFMGTAIGLTYILKAVF